jgi:hypothetical protein
MMENIATEKGKSAGTNWYQGSKQQFAITIIIPIMQKKHSRQANKKYSQRCASESYADNSTSLETSETNKHSE